MVKKSFLLLINSSYLLISKFLDSPRNLVTTDKWEGISRHWAECYSRQIWVTGLKDPLGDMVLLSWILKPKEPPHCPPPPRSTREGTGFGSFLRFRLDFDRVGWADASRAQFPHPAQEAVVRCPVTSPKNGSEPVGACNDHTQHPREYFWGVTRGVRRLPWE